MWMYTERYQTPIGLSEHSGKIYTAGPAALGVDLIEVHVTLSRRMFGPDVIVSLTPGELRQLVEGVKFIQTALAHPVEKDEQAAEMLEMRKLFNKSLVARHGLKAGQTLHREDITAQEEGTEFTMQAPTNTR